MEGCLLVNLPTNIAANILSTWLGGRDLVRLDSAHCQASLRADFLQLIRSPECSVQPWTFDRQNMRSTDHIVEWALGKGTSVEKLSIREDSNLDSYVSMLQVFARKISTIRAFRISLTRLAEGISQCCNLTMIDLKACKLPFSLREVFVHCQRLREFRCSFTGYHPYYGRNEVVDSLESKHLEGLSCANIKILRIVDSDFKLAGALLKLAVCVEVVVLSFHPTTDPECPIEDIFEHINEGLTTLSLQEVFDSEDTLRRLVDRFQQLVHLDLSGCKFTTDMITLLGGLTHLKSVNISSRHSTTNATLAALADACGDRLTELIVFRSSDVTAQFVQAILPRFPLLTSLGMYYKERYDAKAFNLSVLSKMTSLTLSLRGSGYIQFISDLAYHCSAHLEHLHIELYEGITGSKCMDVLVDSCTRLRTLSSVGGVGPDYFERDIARWHALRPRLEVCNLLYDRLSVLRKENDFHLNM